MTKPPIQLLGIPFDAKSSYLRGASNGPDRIREELASEAYNPYTEKMKKVLGPDLIEDRGNIGAAGYDQIYPEVKELLVPGLKPLFLGGDHSITYPLLRLIHEQDGPVHILHFDAHGDLYPELYGDRHSHACPFARIMEDGLCASLTQVGIRAMTPAQVAFAEAHDVRIYGMGRLREFAPSGLRGPVYISLDIDCFDPAFAPGVSHREPGGLTPRQVIDILHGIEAEVIAADIVEFNPLNDHAGITAALCMKMVKELIGLLMARRLTGG